MRIEEHFISEIHESEYNPRITLDKLSREYRAIKQSILDYGFVEPIVVNDITMSCVGGHQRLAVMRDMGMEKIECAMVHIEDAEKEKALCIALNKIKGEWDTEKLDELLGDDELRKFEMGFDNIEVDFGSILDDDDDFSIDDYNDSDTADDGMAIDDEVPDNGMVIKIGNYHFDATVSEYDEMMASIRDEGIFEKSEIIKELERRLCSD
mgnify:CR=1 FL=1|nr:MAG TPA: ParB protein [Caudoviricetes sp.]